MKEWRVDIARFVELIAERMYTEPIKAGIRELITNSLDARIGKVTIEINYGNNRFVYIDDGTGIDPKEFNEIYGKIASGHVRTEDARGIFGIGRMALIAASKKGQIISYRNGEGFEWMFNRSGWDGPNKAVPLRQNGVFLEFEGLTIENLEEMRSWIAKTFSIPIWKGECSIWLNGTIIQTDISADYLIEEVKTKAGKVTSYYKEEIDGTLYICQKGILVKEEPYTGLTAYVDQGFLDIKTDREGFMNNEKYRTFKSDLMKELAELRPVKSFQKMEVDFIRRLMREFKRYWETKAKTTNHVMERLQLEFPEKGEEIVEEKGEIPETPETIPIPEQYPEIQHGPEHEIQDYGGSTVAPSEEKPEVIQEPVSDEAYEPKSEEIVPLQPTETKEEQEEPQKESKKESKEEEKVIKIKGAKPADLGEDFPMIFFESEPFVLVFNTSHPLFRKLIERQKLGSHELMILFERMMESAYFNENPSEDLEKIKERWKTVDKKLIPLFKQKKEV